MEEEKKYQVKHEVLNILTPAPWPKVSANYKWPEDQQETDYPVIAWAVRRTQTINTENNAVETDTTSIVGMIIDPIYMDDIIMVDEDEEIAKCFRGYLYDDK